MEVSTYEWVTPKTDWKVSYDENGRYVGDYFEPSDYNRIKNNINFLRDYVYYLFDNKVEFLDLGEDVYYGSTNELKASWWKILQDNLENINKESVSIDIGARENYYSNSSARLVEELNRIEQACLKIYTKMYYIQKNKQKLKLRLGNLRELG